MMQESTHILEDRAQSYQSWEARCECSASKAAGDYMMCRCGAAQLAGLVCKICEDELVVRQNQRTGSEFWGCCNFSKSGCEFTRRLHPSEAPRAPSPNTGISQASKRQRLVVTPSPESQSTYSEYLPPVSGKTKLKPVNLFPCTKLLRDTFVGSRLEPGLVAAGVPKQVHCDFDSLRNPKSGSPSRIKLFYEENLSQQCFRYWYEPREIGKQPPGRAPPSRKPVVLELFAGAGGMSEGLKRAGFDVKYAVEGNVAATDTLRSNHKDTIVFQQDVVEFLDPTKPKSACYPRDIDHIHASPPCQGFSEAKKRCGQLTAQDKHNNELIFQFTTAVRQCQPYTASLENVTGIFSTAEKKHYLQKVVADLLEMEYQVHVMILDASDFGVPQRRQRLFLLAARKGLPLPRVPKNTGYKRCTVEEALGNLETTEPVERGIPVLDGNGGVVYDHVVEDKFVRCDRITYARRKQPSNTVCRRNGISHYGHDRLLTIRERSFLQTFPKYYHFCGTPEQQSDQIGNAVPVNVAEAVGRSIMQSYK